MLASERKANRRLLSTAASCAACSLRQRHVLLGMALDLLRFLVKLGENAYLGAEDLGNDGRQNVVDGAERVSLGRVHFVGERRHEDDRCVRRLAPGTNHRGRFEAVHFRHLHVEQDHGVLALE